HHAGTMIAIDDVVEPAGLLVPEAGGEARAGAREVLLPTLREAAADRERVQPERLHLHRLPDPRRHHPVADLGVHPRELDAGLAGGEQAVDVAVDTVARALGVAGQDRV